MARLRHGKHPKETGLKPHEQAVLRVYNVAHELGYNVIEYRIMPGPGPDLVIKNPKNNRLVVVEVELSYASQIQTREKFGRLWHTLIKNKGNTVFLIFGVSRDQLSKDLSKAPANASDASRAIGIKVFTAPTTEEKYQIQTALLRCLGDE